MKKKWIRMAAAAAFFSLVFSSCQKAPELSGDSDIMHAKDQTNDKVQEIIQNQEQTDAGKSGEEQRMISCTIGAGSNSIRIEAQMPQIPNMGHDLRMKADSRLDENKLRGLFQEGETIEDKSQELDKAIKQEQESAEEEYEISNLGDENTLLLESERLKIERRTIGSLTFQEKKLYDDCIAIENDASMQEIEIRPGDRAEASYDGFSLEDANQMLAELLKELGIEEIHVFQAAAHQSKEGIFYEISFTPSYEGVGFSHEFGQTAVGEIHPMGRVWSCKEGVADMQLDNFCIETIEKGQEQKILSWEQILQILDVYLQGDKLLCSPDILFTQAEYEYLPVLEEGVLHCIPVWHIYVPLTEWTEDETKAAFVSEEGCITSICINAVTGEIEWMQ